MENYYWNIERKIGNVSFLVILFPFATRYMYLVIIYTAITMI